MVKFYVLQIKMGKMTIEQVPSKYRDAVIACLGTSDKTELG